MIECSFYIFSSVSIFWEPKLKDRNEMLLHHFATLSLIIFSGIYGILRIGTIIMVLHDVADPFMEVGKVSLYLGKQKVLEIYLMTEFWT